MDKKQEKLKSEILSLNDAWLRSVDFKNHGKSTPERQDLLEKLGDRATREAMFLPARKGVVYTENPPVLSHAIVLPTQPILAIRLSEHKPMVPLPDAALRLMKDPMKLLDIDEMDLEHLKITRYHLTRPQRVGRQGIIAAGFSELNEMISRHSNGYKMPIPA